MLGPVSQPFVSYSVLKLLSGTYVSFTLQKKKLRQEKSVRLFKPTVTHCGGLGFDPGPHGLLTNMLAKAIQCFVSVLEVELKLLWISGKQSTTEVCPKLYFLFLC